LEAIKRKLIELLDEKFQTEGFQDCFAVEVVISKSNRVQVFVDCDSGLNLAMCGKLSRHLEAYLDESLVLGEKYTLDVSSPGIGRPLIRRQYHKNVGRMVKVYTNEDKRIKGKLLEIKEEAIIVEVDISKKEKESIEIAFSDIKESKIIVSF